MKIISGKYKGRNIEGYNILGTRPTMDRIRESLFASIQNEIKGKKVLDLFAGTGALGFEALSNGALKSYLNDFNPKCIKMINKTKEKLGIENIDIKMFDYKRAICYYYEKNIDFDVIFLDPPYDMHILSSLMEEIKEKKLLKVGGIIVCEYETETISSPYPIYKEKRYGSKKITIYKNEESL